MLALSPLLLLGVGALGWWLTDGATTPTTPYVLGGLASISVLWVALGALTDFRRLGSLGHEHRASVAWIIAGPLFYLMVRAIHIHRTMRTGTAPAWVFIILTIAVGVGVAALSLFIPRDAGLAELRAVETQLASDMLLRGLTYSVQCPSQASAAVGSSFVCTAYDEIGPAALIRVTWVGLGEFDYSIE
jgi:Meckel syndrome type 1 protein